MNTPTESHLQQWQVRLHNNLYTSNHHFAAQQLTPSSAPGQLPDIGTVSGGGVALQCSLSGFKGLIPTICPCVHDATIWQAPCKTVPLWVVP